MTKYFGTDGIRGKANEGLDVSTAFKVGRYLGYHFLKDNKKRILVGKDTRLSSSMFESAIAAGASSSGIDVYLLGECPTPAVSYLTRSKDFSCGIMISASHNPYYDNGIKVIAGTGEKISQDIEELIEKYIDDEVTIPLATSDNIGRVIDFSLGLDEYLDYLMTCIDVDLEGMTLAIDCANGSACTTAEKLLKRLKATCTIISDQPNGVNINTNCGSTHPEALQALVRSGKYDLGLAFDGDADRLIAVNSDGELINGDYILYICGNYLKSQNRLKNNMIVTTVMANLGLFKALDKLDINYQSTQVGDKYVYECMVNNDYIIGGEQSGHIIFKEFATTGDGLLTALKLLEVMKHTGKSIVELSEGLKIYPQLLVNVAVSDKEAMMKDKDVLAEVDKVNEELNNNGRILVRTSGTESLVRVMVEAETDELCSKYVNQVVEVIKSKI